MQLNPILARFQNEPTLVAAGSKPWFEACVASAAATLMRVESVQDTPQMADDFWFHPSDWRAAYRPYTVKDGILHIPVKGVLLNDFGYALGSWATGYTYIQKAFDRGMGDPDVRGIALIIDSPGGMVAGNFDLVDRIYARRGEKPIAAFAHEAAYSAAYSLGSAADPGRFYVARTGGVGSIGVVTTHIDASKRVAEDGYVVTFIHAGAHKVDGNAYEPLPAEVQARIQERIDALYAIFVTTVSRNRGLAEEAVRATEAATFMAPEALSNGLADHIGSIDDALADFSASLNLNSGDENMADITQADHDTALAAVRTEAASAQAAAVAEARKAEKARVAGITGCDEAKGRETMANHLAMNTDMSVEDAQALLATAPKTEPKGEAPLAGAGKKIFDAAMGNTDNPDLNEGDEDADDGASASRVNGVFEMRGKKRA